MHRLRQGFIRLILVASLGLIPSLASAQVRPTPPSPPVRPAPTSAQPARSGFWFGVGGGYGSSGVACEECGESDRESGGVVYLKGGYALNERTLVGVELNVWTKTWEDLEPGVDATINLYNFSGTVTFYPVPTRGLFLKGGLGGSSIDSEFKVLGSTLTADLGTGFGLLAGAGYDIPLGRRVALTPAINVWYGRPGDLKVLGETLFADWRQNVVDFTIGITFP